MLKGHTAKKIMGEEDYERSNKRGSGVFSDTADGGSRDMHILPGGSTDIRTSDRAGKHCGFRTRE